MQIYQFERDRYFCNEYLVEIDSYHGNGWCSCRDFACRHQPKLEKAENCGIKLPLQRCKHIIEVMAWVNTNTISQAHHAKEE